MMLTTSLVRIAWVVLLLAATTTTAGQRVQHFDDDPTRQAQNIRAVPAHLYLVTLFAVSSPAAPP